MDTCNTFKSWKLIEVMQKGKNKWNLVITETSSYNLAGTLKSPNTLQKRIRRLVAIYENVNLVSAFKKLTF